MLLLLLEKLDSLSEMSMYTCVERSLIDYIFLKNNTLQSLRNRNKTIDIAKC